MECDYCKHSFSSKGILISHQKTAKYCLILQNKNSDNFLCNFCSKKFTSQYNLNEHFIICREKQYKDRDNKEVNQLKEQIINLEIIQKYTQTMLNEKNEYICKLETNIGKLEAKLETTIEKLEAKLEKFEDSILSKTEKKAIQPITNNTTNIVINNTLNLNDIKQMTSFLEDNLDKDVLVNGQKGVAVLLSSTILKGRYKCVDTSRQNFEFTNELGEIERDVKAKKLTNALIKSDICSKSADKGMELWKKADGTTDSLGYQAHFDRVLEMINFNRDNSVFRSELSALTS